MLNVNWSAPVSSSSQVDWWKADSRWTCIEVANNETIKHYLIRIINLDPRDYAWYKVHAQQPSGTLDLKDHDTKKFIIEIRGISIELFM